MSRRFITGVAVMVLGLSAIGATAAANPTYEPATISATFNGGDQYTMTMGNFGMPDGADDSIDLSVTYSAPSGLRSTPALAGAAVRAESYSFVPDSDGNYTAVVRVTESGTVYFTATGSPSGKTASTSVVHSAVKASGTSGNTASTGVSTDSGLATTGTSIAGPVAVGILALMAGLALLFFGTRGIARRRGDAS